MVSRRPELWRWSYCSWKMVLKTSFFPMLAMCQKACTGKGRGEEEVAEVEEEEEEEDERAER
jgi:hypothetical protein